MIKKKSLPARQLDIHIINSEVKTEKESNQVAKAYQKQRKQKPSLQTQRKERSAREIKSYGTRMAASERIRQQYLKEI